VLQARDPYVEEFSKLGQQELQEHQKKAIDRIHLLQDLTHEVYHKRIMACVHPNVSSDLKQELEDALRTGNENEWERRIGFIFDICMDEKLSDYIFDPPSVNDPTAGDDT
jgi:hypothetical protein